MSSVAPVTPPAPLAPPPSSLLADPPKPKTDSTGMNVVGGFLIVGTVFAWIFTLIFHYGAARLSYMKYQSIGWAILNFFFAVFYYPFYALVLAEPIAPTSMFGGSKALKGLMKMFR
jgi:hypothetical protein